MSALLAEAGAVDAGYRLLDASRGGFARVDAALAQALFDFEARTGIELDPLYTAKALIALRQHVEAGYLAAGSRVIMLHTGACKAAEPCCRACCDWLATLPLQLMPQGDGMTEPLNPDQLRSLTPLNALSEQQWRELRSQLVPQPLLAGQALFRRGDQARLTYYLLAGELQLRDADGAEQRLVAGSEASCHPLSPSLPRLQEALALTEVSVLAIDSATLARLITWRSAYQDLLLQLDPDGDQEWLEHLLENPLFAKVPPANVQEMVKRLQRIELPAGSEVLREGEAGIAATSCSPAVPR